MDDAKIYSRYTNLLEKIYKTANFHIIVNDDLKTDNVKTNRGISQGDTISVKLFTLGAEEYFWNTTEILKV